VLRDSPSITGVDSIAFKCRRMNIGYTWFELIVIPYRALCSPDIDITVANKSISNAIVHSIDHDRHPPLDRIEILKIMAFKAAENTHAVRCH
jgi:hypothetical protein